MNRVLFSSQTDEWRTPESVYKALDSEFRFNDDPCPPHGQWGLERAWGTRTFCNPPYSQIAQWVKKAYDETPAGKLIVLLIPSRTDTRWWHDYVMQATEIRFIKGRLKFYGAKFNAPFPSCVVVFNGEERCKKCT